MRRRLSGTAVLMAVLAAMSAAAGSGRADMTPIRVLFIGNSYTMFNDMPDMLAEMGRGLGYDIRPEVRAVGGASFADHRRSAETLQVIADERWDVVVLQNHSLAPGLRPRDVRAQSVPDARFLAGRIKDNDPATRIIYYATWGRRNGNADDCPSYPKVCTFDGHSATVQRGYRLYQQATGGDIAPVGTNWQRVVHDHAFERPFAASRLWLDDGSHPSRLGSYFAAATILRAIIKSPIGPSDFTAGLPPDAAAYLRRIADTP